MCNIRLEPNVYARWVSYQIYDIGFNLILYGVILMFVELWCNHTELKLYLYRDQDCGQYYANLCVQVKE